MHAAKLELKIDPCKENIKPELYLNGELITNLHQLRKLNKL